MYRGRPAEEGSKLPYRLFSIGESATAYQARSLVRVLQAERLLHVYLIFYWFLAVLSDATPLPPSTFRERLDRCPTSYCCTAATSTTNNNVITVRDPLPKVIGTHNSYHRRTGIPGVNRFWPYDFPSLTTQLDAGVRHLELDVHYDWKTGRY